MQLDLNLKAPVTVSELTRRIKETLEAGFADVWVQGEVSGMSVPSSGHLYFSLKDKGAQIRAVFFRSGLRFLKFRPQDGLEVIVRGRVSVYEPRGEYQIIVEYMEPKGLGALQLAFLQLKERLEKEGLFDPGRKRPLPPFPKTVGVVTSPTGAAIRDILKVLERRAPGVGVLVAPASVQGEAAPGEIARAIADLNEAGVDVIIAGRGGGSAEDLFAFNTEPVARAIFGSKIPVISAVGHETDFTIADFVADIRAATPSAAAEVVARSEEDVREGVRSLARRMSGSILGGIRLAKGQLVSETRALGDPRRILQERLLRVDDCLARIVSSKRRLLTRNSERVGSLSRTLASLDPLSPLKRGFAMARKLPGLTVIKDASELSAGDMLRLRFLAGEADCRVETKH